MKKKRQRMWYIPVYKEGYEKVEKTGKLPEGVLAFDNFDDAYSYAASIRLRPIRDDNEELILDENGNAKLPDLGKITIFSIHGKHINWQNVELLSDTMHGVGLRDHRDAISILESMKLTQRIIDSIKEESDDWYRASLIGGAEPNGVTATS